MRNEYPFMSMQRQVDNKCGGTQMYMKLMSVNWKTGITHMLVNSTLNKQTTMNILLGASLQPLYVYNQILYRTTDKYQFLTCR